MSFAFRPCVAGAWLALLAALSLPGPLADAQTQSRETLVREGISEDAAVALVREQTDGKVVRVDRQMEGGRLIYRIRVLKPDGRLRDYRVDAATGALR